MLTTEEQKQVEEVAEKWMQAANQGLAIAQCNLGFVYDKGQGVPQSDKEAVKWYQMAAEQGDSDALNHLEILRLKLKQQNSESVAKAPALASEECGQCGLWASNLRACCRCKVVFYCNRECQSAHWKAGHKGSCTPSRSYGVD